MTDKDDSEKRDNIFEILDGIMIQLSRTKKIFVIMILTTLIIPPVVLLAMTAAFDAPFQERFEQRLQENLQSGEITEEEYNNIKAKIIGKGKGFFFHPHQMVIFVISLVWLGIGIRQWIVLSKWDKRYKRFKKKREDADKNLDDPENGDESKS